MGNGLEEVAEQALRGPYRAARHGPTETDHAAPAAQPRLDGSPAKKARPASGWRSGRTAQRPLRLRGSTALGDDQTDRRRTVGAPERRLPSRQDRRPLAGAVPDSAVHFASANDLIDVRRIDRLIGAPRHRGYLPHFSDRSVTQFLTIRLADSLPAEVLRRLHLEPSPRKRRRTAERLLDASHGSCLLARPACADVVEQALFRRSGQDLHLLAWVVMPNHVHALFEVIGTKSLARIVHGFKTWTARRINALAGRSGRLWQRDYFDRQALDPAETARFRIYIEANPVKAGFCNSPEDWRYSSAWARHEGLLAPD